MVMILIGVVTGATRAKSIMTLTDPTKEETSILFLLLKRFNDVIQKHIFIVL